MRKIRSPLKQKIKEVSNQLIKNSIEMRKDIFLEDAEKWDNFYWTRGSSLLNPD